MRNGNYALYLTTYQQARLALAVGDERWQRALCTQVAGRGGMASTVSLLAMSDAECGLEPRARRDILGVCWREVLADRTPRAPTSRDARSFRAAAVIRPAA